MADLPEFEADAASLAHTPITTPLALLLLAAVVPYLPDAIGHTFEMASVMLDAAAYRTDLLDGQVTLRAVLRRQLPGARLLRMLQARHAAVLNDYILWLLAGFTAMMSWVLIAV